MRGLDFLNNRHYDPSVGVFVSVDPIVTLTMEPYAYGSGNPVTYSDPSGLCSVISGNLWCSGRNYGANGSGYDAVDGRSVAMSRWIAHEDGRSKGGGASLSGAVVGGLAAQLNRPIEATVNWIMDVAELRAKGLNPAHPHSYQVLDAPKSPLDPYREGSPTREGMELLTTVVVNGVVLTGGAAMNGGSSVSFVGPSGQAVRPALRTIDDILEHPYLLAGRSPEEVRRIVGVPNGWRVGSLGQGTHKGQGFVLRQFTEAGHPTGRLIRWHPGGGRHGPDPYWRVSTGSSKSGIVPGLQSGGPNPTRYR